MEVTLRFGREWDASNWWVGVRWRCHNVIICIFNRKNICFGDFTASPECFIYKFIWILFLSVKLGRTITNGLCKWLVCRDAWWNTLAYLLGSDPARERAGDRKKINCICQHEMKAYFLKLLFADLNIEWIPLVFEMFQTKKNDKYLMLCWTLSSHWKVFFHIHEWGNLILTVNVMNDVIEYITMSCSRVINS